MSGLVKEEFNLTFSGDKGKYIYKGVRTKDGNKYVLLFDHTRKVFVLHKLDSIFHMNVTRTPELGSAEKLKARYPHLQVRPRGNKAKGKASAAQRGRAAEKDKQKPSEKGKAAADKTSTQKSSASQQKPLKSNLKDARGKKAGDAAPAKSVDLVLPPPPPAKATQEATATSSSSAGHNGSEKKKKKRAASVSSEEESEESDYDGLTLEYPGGPPPEAKPFKPAFQLGPQRRFSDFVRHLGEEEQEQDPGGMSLDIQERASDDDDDDADVDADGDEVMEDVVSYNQQRAPLPRHVADESDESEEDPDPEPEPSAAAVAAAPEIGEDELDAALEAELEAELLESEVSEED